ncbi:Mov34/MPN/PAD-1 family protein [Sphingomonas aracearum]|uniref:MPN domain-containing protein n=1 Tax=Sphingomonas aracearum TaxID=2283317 RepID=A0A369VVZ0_9SPHN|nr:M67 family metallopeptidase [Sphingomonas aracearum]RDE05232.1 hypothetical protein DVW87_08140 [Sphingomonas aracearum]
MKTEISRYAAETILREAAASPLAEVCGLLLGQGGRIAEARPCRNIADDPARRFEIDPAALLAAHRAARGSGPALLGHYHSHPSGKPEPSACDAAHALDVGALWIITDGCRLCGWRVVAPGRFDPEELVVA